MPINHLHHFPKPKGGIDPLKNITPARAPDILPALLLLPFFIFIFIYIFIPSRLTPQDSRRFWQPSLATLPIKSANPPPPVGNVPLAIFPLHKPETLPIFSYFLLSSFLPHRKY